MPKFTADYFERRAARERAFAEKTTPWFRDVFLRTAQEFERRAARLRGDIGDNSPRPQRAAGRRILTDG